jgi:hypothetical protein
MGDSFFTLNFEGNDALAELPILLAEHDRLHTAVYQEMTEGVEDQSTSDAIDANVAKVLDVLGLQGIVGLVHLAQEALVDKGRQGIELTPEGEFVNENEGKALVALSGTISRLQTTLNLIAVYEGKLPPPDDEAPFQPTGPQVSG